METDDRASTLADRFRAHAGQQTHLYGHVMRAMADDWEAGGPVRTVCAGYEDAPRRAVIQLRLLAGIFRLVLTGRADELRPFYPCLGGTAPPDQAWPVMRDVVAAHVPELRQALTIAPQTNEVGRSAALLAGLYDVLDRSRARSVRLLEVGASGGLNLLLDRFRIEATDGSWAYGPADAPLRLAAAVEGPAHAVPFTITERRGCDPHPIDPTTDDGRLLLTSFVWPFDLHRHARLEAAFAVVDAVGGVPVDAAGAADWLSAVLPRPSDAELTVVWRSITQQYWPDSEIDRVAALLDTYGSQHPLATVSLEFRQGIVVYARPELSTTVWTGDGTPGRERLIGTAHDHGPPVQLTG